MRKKTNGRMFRKGGPPVRWFIIAPRYLDSRRLVAGGRDCVYVTNLSSRETVTSPSHEGPFQPSRFCATHLRAEKKTRAPAKDRSGPNTNAINTISG
jgi:hypothetical protein